MYNLHINNQEFFMARIGISYEQVAACADTLNAAGVAPTIAAVRQSLGTGSPNTIHKHLTAWKACSAPSASAAAVPSRAIPEKLLAALMAEIDQAANAARSAAITDLAESQAVVTELARAGELAETEIESLQEQIAALTTQRDQAQAIADERLETIERLDHRVERDELAHGATRQELEKAKQHIIALEFDHEQLDTTRKALAAKTDACNEATQNAAVLRSQLAAADARTIEAREREQAMADKLEKVQELERLARSELQRSQLHTMAQQIALDNAARQLEKAPRRPAVAKKTAKPAPKA